MFQGKNVGLKLCFFIKVEGDFIIVHQNEAHIENYYVSTSIYSSLNTQIYFLLIWSKFKIVTLYYFRVVQVILYFTVKKL